MLNINLQKTPSEQNWIELIKSFIDTFFPIHHSYFAQTDISQTVLLIAPYGFSIDVMHRRNKLEMMIL